MNILYLILVLLVVTRVFAELAERAGLPSIVGELVAGVALGIVLQYFYEPLQVLYSATQSASYTSIVSLGMFFLMLRAGILMEPLEFARSSKSAVVVAVGGMIIPVGAGMMLGLAVLPDSSIKLVQSLFLQPFPVPIIVESLFSAIVIMALVVTVLTPILLRYLIPEKSRSAG